MACKTSRNEAAAKAEAEGRVVPLKRRGRRCPVCGQPAQERFRPFCSRRCADLDLGRWLKGHYRIPSEEPADDEDLPGRGEE